MVQVEPDEKAQVSVNPTPLPTLSVGMAQLKFPEIVFKTTQYVVLGLRMIPEPVKV